MLAGHTKNSFEVITYNQKQGYLKKTITLHLSVIALLGLQPVRSAPPQAP